MDEVTPLSVLRKRILEERGLELVKKPRSNRSVVRRKKPPVSGIPKRLKTKPMLLLELQVGRSIDYILTDGSLREVASKYSLSKSTAYNWKRQLTLVWSESNLPSCVGCTMMDTICIGTHYCNVLLRSHAVDKLLNLKKEKLDEDPSQLSTATGIS